MRLQEVSSDEVRVSYLHEKVYGGTTTKSSNSLVVFKCDLYGDKKPWQIWNDQGGLKLNKGEDLYFFTKLKKFSLTGSRFNRHAGSDIQDGCFVDKRYFQYENESGSESDDGWNMDEYSLADGGVDPYILCLLRRKIKGHKRKSTNIIPSRHYSCSSSSSSVGYHH